MATLVAWLHGLISLVLLLALAELLLPDGSMRPYVRTILGVVLVVALLRPLVQLGAFDWSLPAFSLPQAPAEGAVARGERLAAALRDRARQEAESQAALQAAGLLEMRAGVRAESVSVRLTPEGWVERVWVVLGGGAAAGPGTEGGSRGGEAPGGAPEVGPVGVPPIRVGEVRTVTASIGGAAAPDPGAEPGGDGTGRLRSLLADFYQIPIDRVQVEPGGGGGP